MSIDDFLDEYPQYEKYRNDMNRPNGDPQAIRIIKTRKGYKICAPWLNVEFINKRK